MVRLVFILIWAAALVPGASLLEQRIEQTLRTSQAVAPASVGLHVVQLATGRTIYSRNADKLFIPASNTKLFSTALALVRLGPDHRMTTRLEVVRPPDANGRIAGDLVLVGGGDPSMSFIPIPYEEDAERADPMGPIEDFADAVAARGVRIVAGDIVGDDTAYQWDPFPPGWGLTDPVWEYGAPVGALTLGNNSIRLELIPGTQDGDPAAIQVTPSLEYFIIDNRTRTAPVAEQDLEVRRLSPRHLEISGVVPLGKPSRPLWLAVDDPGLYAATALYDALSRRGIQIGGRPVARHRRDEPPLPRLPATVLVERSSPPLSELVRVVDKVSQNLWAELVLREVARVQTGIGSRKAGLEQLQSFLKEIGVGDNDYQFQDGSGLSRLTLVTPDAIVRLLRYMHASPLQGVWIAALPVGGADGTLAKRFGKDPAAKSIQAKTGSLSHVNALSGYADSATYGELAFSVLVNNTRAPSSEVREFIDRIGMILLD